VSRLAVDNVTSFLGSRNNRDIHTRRRRRRRRHVSVAHTCTRSEIVKEEHIDVCDGCLFIGGRETDDSGTGGKDAVTDGADEDTEHRLGDGLWWGGGVDALLPRGCGNALLPMELRRRWPLLVLALVLGPVTLD
jgi:hypothetical protein